MASANAVRIRRHRLHKKGDHSECLAANCSDAGQRGVTAVSQNVSRGETLWQQMRGDDLGPLERTLLEEACRIADRLDKLDRALQGRAVNWLKLVADSEDPTRLIVVIDRPLGEARQHALALKQLLADLRAAGAGKVKTPVNPGKGVAGVADLAAFTARRSTKSAG
jgi:tRNA(Met) C34 N-acetyltransferase TmcA